MMEHFLYGVAVSLVVWCGFVLCFCFVSCLLCLRLHPGVDSGLRNGPRSFLTPQCGMLIHALSNSFISTNTV